MTSGKPHYLLFCDGNVSANGDGAGSQRGRWRFVLEDLVSGERIEATDQEIGCAPDRSALVAVLRGLEALEQPSRVTLVTTSRYVTRGLQCGLTEWRDNDYSWEHFGAVQPIRNADIWKRIDRALAYHQVQCRWMAQEGVSEPTDETPPAKNDAESKSVLSDQATAENAMACLESKVANATQTRHRPPASSPGTRVGVSMSKYQRVYVDTPHPESPSNSADKYAVEQAGQVVSIPTAISGLAPGKKNNSHFSGASQGPFATAKIVGYWLSWPVRLVCSGPLWLCSHLWDAILTLDEWLESFLRCLFLLEPSKRIRRR